MLKTNLKIALRNLLRRRQFTTINVVGMGLGMAAAILTGLWVQNEWSHDRYHRLSDRIYRINTDLPVSDDETWYWATTPLPLLDILENDIPEVRRAASFGDNPWRAILLRNGDASIANRTYGYVSENWFELFDHQFLSGSPVGFQEQLRSVMLTRGIAEKLFGDWNVAGQTLEVDSTEFVVRAVIEDHPLNSSFTQEVIFPLSYFLSDPANAENSNNWGNFNYATFVELLPDAELTALDQKLTAIIRRNGNNEGTRLSVQPLTEAYFDAERQFGALRTGDRQTVLTFALIGFIILLLSCVNYVSLTTALAGDRTKNIGVRKVLGANGPQVFRLLLAESGWTIALALLLSLSLVWLVLPAFNNLTEQTFRLDPANPVVWGVAGGTALAALVLSGVYPALFLTGFSPLNFLRGQNVLKRKNAGFRRGLVVLQFTLTAGLIVGAMVIYQQQRYLQNKDLGYDRAQVFEFTMPYDPGRPEKVRLIKQNLLTQPSIADVALANGSVIDMQSTHSGSIDYAGKPEDFTPTVSQLSVDEHFGELLEFSLAEGRWFQADLEADTRNVLLNEAAVAHLRLQEPVVGQRFSFHGNEGQVIGVVKNFNFEHLRQPIKPLVLYQYAPSHGNFAVKSNPGQIAQAIAAARGAWELHNPDQPFEYRFMDDSFDRLYRGEAKTAGLFRVLAGLAVFLSALGLFGLSVFVAESRRREIGIRKVLGAGVPLLVRQLSADFLKLVGIALVIAIPLAWYLGEQWLQNYSFRTSISGWHCALLALAVLVIAFLTVSIQSVRAALANPVEALRE